MLREGSKIDAYIMRAESRRPMTFKWAVKRFALSPPKEPGSW